MDFLIVVVVLMGALLVFSGIRSIVTRTISGDDINGKYTPESIRGFSRIYGTLETLSGLFLLVKSALDLLDRYLIPIPSWIGWLMFGLAVAVLAPLWFMEKKYLVELPGPDENESDENESEENGSEENGPEENGPEENEPEVSAVVSEDGVRLVKEKTGD